MAQTKKAKEQETNQQENIQTNEQENNQVQLEANDQTETPPSRRAGFNQPIGNQATRSEGRSQEQGLSRREESSFLSPFSFMARFSEEMDRLFEDFGFGGGFLVPSSGSFQNSMWSPLTEVFEREGQLVIQADLPGMSKDDINIDIEEDQIVIRGERHNEREENREGFYHSERSYGSFYRSIPLPQNIDSEQANATFRNGVLEITMPLPEERQRKRRLEISEGEQASQQKQGKQPSGKNKGNQ